MREDERNGFNILTTTNRVHAVGFMADSFASVSEISLLKSF
jgi:hypothetical protein